jgi:hypothetical protein
VLAWVERIAPASDDVDIALAKDSLRGMFDYHGWEPSANCGPYLDKDDARNVAGYIIGQWLECDHPIVSSFTANWRAKFQSVDNVDASANDAMSAAA